ncbi:MAG: hypothetical protein M1830_001520 [Pleopsidium flavum]|nr:MAG: hypothetical protein M1830_001520 [Pleopsidium flavum]
MAPTKAVQGLLWQAMRPQQQHAFQRFFSTAQCKGEEFRIRRQVSPLSIKKRRVVSKFTNERSYDTSFFTRDRYSDSGSAAVQDSVDPRKTLDQPGYLSSHPFLNPFVNFSPAQHVRKLMRRVPHSVAVITSNMPPYTPPDSYRGMTVSSFNTVTLEPDVIVSFNVRQPSSTYDAIKASGRFDVHVLDGSPLGAAIAERFSQGHGKHAFLEAEQLRDRPETLFVTKSNAEPGGREPPVIASDEVMFALNCELLPESVQLGDHVIVLGRVVDHKQGPDRRVEDVQSLGLIYVNRCYRRPGKRMTSPANLRPGSSAGSPSDKVGPSISGAGFFTDLSQEQEKKSDETPPHNPTNYRLVSGPLSEAGARMRDGKDDYWKRIHLDVENPIKTTEPQK